MISGRYGNQQQPIKEQYIIQLFLSVSKAIQAMHTMTEPIAHRDITVSD